MAPGEPIRLSWWNTGLAPGGKSRGDNERYETATLVLQQLLEFEGAGLLALGEIAPVDVQACLRVAGATRVPLAWRTPTAKTGRASSVAVFYDPRRLTLLRDKLLTDSFGGVAFDTGWHLEFQACNGGAVLNVVVVHWPSHMFEDAARKRIWIATSLHRAFCEDRDVVILGDFNDEPFSDSLRDGLVAYRDRALVRRREGAYYNPFWRLLGEQQHVEQEHTGRLPAGTHFHSSGTSTRWVTYDQVAVSSSLIGANSWQLVESATRIVLHEALLTDGGTMRDIFDHLPIATALTYTPENTDA
jgi:endonuclease/exonuclease/phosphatase family protein